MKITIEKAVLEQALDALENNAGEFRVEGAAAILREALAQPAAQPTEPAGEPYAWHYRNKGGSSVLHLQPGTRLDADMQAAKDFPQAHFITPLFTRPAVPLSDEQIDATAARFWSEDGIDPVPFARAIEAAHKIGGAE